VLVWVWVEGLVQALELAPDLAPEQVPGRVPVMALAWVAVQEPAVEVLAESERVVVEQAWGLVPVPVLVLALVLALAQVA
jgi:hypothetical protein